MGKETRQPSPATLPKIFRAACNRSGFPPIHIDYPGTQTFGWRYTRVVLEAGWRWAKAWQVPAFRNSGHGHERWRQQCGDDPVVSQDLARAHADSWRSPPRPYWIGAP